MDPRLRDHLFRIIAQDIGVDFSKVDPGVEIRSQVAIDSMQFIAIMARIEHELRIEIPTTMLEIRTLNEFFAVIESLLKEKGKVSV